MCSAQKKNIKEKRYLQTTTTRALLTLSRVAISIVCVRKRHVDSYTNVCRRTLVIKINTTNHQISTNNQHPSFFEQKKESSATGPCFHHNTM